MVVPLIFRHKENKIGKLCSILEFETLLSNLPVDEIFFLKTNVMRAVLVKVSWWYNTDTYYNVVKILCWNIQVHPRQTGGMRLRRIF